MEVAMLQLAQYRSPHGAVSDAAYWAERARQAEQAAADADCIEAIHAHAVMALHYRVRSRNGD
jgi:hypothetical protein